MECLIELFEKYLKNQELATETIKAYINPVKFFYMKYNKLNKENLIAYKTFLLSKYKPQTVNLRLNGINKYLEFIGRDTLKLKLIKFQRKNFVDNVISNEDYNYLKTQLLKDGYDEYYFMIWFMAATGARVSELLQIRREHVLVGYIDIYGKGYKIHRIYIPKTLQKETLLWLDKRGVTSGYIFTSHKGKYHDTGQRMTRQGVHMMLKQFAEKYDIDKNVVYAHSFRHLFAKNFVSKCNDIMLLADLMGHNSLETTRIYLRRTNVEQKKIVDEVITW